MSNNEEPAGPLRLLLKLDEVNTRIDDWRNGASKPIKGPAHEAHKAGRPVPLSGFLGEALAYWSRARADAAPLFNKLTTFWTSSAALTSTPHLENGRRFEKPWHPSEASSVCCGTTSAGLLK